jgi:hypothetical protein
MPIGRGEDAESIATSQESCVETSDSKAGLGPEWAGQFNGIARGIDEELLAVHPSDGVVADDPPEQLAGRAFCLRG